MRLPNYFTEIVKAFANLPGLIADKTAQSLTWAAQYVTAPVAIVLAVVAVLFAVAVLRTKPVQR
jgi:hypothetical protein